MAVVFSQAAACSAALRRNICPVSSLIHCIPVRNARRKAGEIKPRYYLSQKLQTVEFPTESQSLANRLAELNRKDPVLDARVDIGFPHVGSSRKDRRKTLLSLKNQINSDPKLASAAISGTLLIDLDKVKEDSKQDEERRFIREAADHYGVFDSLFKHGYFTPSVVMDISYDYDQETVSPVYKGNIIAPSDAKQVPTVSYEATPDSLWTLILTCPDEHFVDNEAEYVHWFIGNIKGNDISTGEVICDYLQPFPPRGSGYHRYVFVLYKQEKEIDYSAFKRKAPCTSLPERTFKTFDFYKERQDVLTPAGLAFFQSSWDESLSDFFHNVLCMREPIFEYDFPPQYFKPQVKYPHKEPFNLYLDRYRDPKELKKEVLLKRLKMIHPFEEEPPFPKFPGIFPFAKNLPSWLKTQMNKERWRVGRYRDLRPYTAYPQPEPKKFVKSTRVFFKERR